MNLQQLSWTAYKNFCVAGKNIHMQSVGTRNDVPARLHFYLALFAGIKSVKGGKITINLLYKILKKQGLNELLSNREKIDKLVQDGSFIDSYVADEMLKNLIDIGTNFLERGSLTKSTSPLL